MSHSERTIGIAPGGTLPDGYSEFAENADGPAPRGTSSSAVKQGDAERLTVYEFIDTRELARRLTVPASWIRDQVRARSEDPLPHVNLGKYVRFLGSPALELWITRRIVVGNNRRLGRTQRKEQE